jgi:hypothetical protein
MSFFDAVAKTSNKKTRHRRRMMISSSSSAAVHFEPKYEEFRSRTIWSLSNAFTLAFNKLDPIAQFKATAKVGKFLELRFSRPS